MPELPEAETIARTLAPRLEGRTIVEVRFFTERARRGPPPQIAGKVIRRVGRYGKIVLLELSEGVLLIHLGMTGRLLFGGTPGPYTRAVLVLDRGAVRFDDVRMFGHLRWLEKPPEHLGPDPLAISREEFAARLRARRGAIKPLLLNQTFLRGIGNIYADETLFRARIHPRTRASSLGRERADRLHAAMRQVLGEAIAAGGSSISDYVDADERAGSFQFLHRVYQRTGEPCMECGAPIRRIVMTQRGTHYCPRCQKR